MIANYCMSCNHVHLALMPSYECPRCRSSWLSWRYADAVDVILGVSCAIMRIVCWLKGV